MLRMNTPGSSACACMRIRSPSTAPPVKGLDGSTATTPTVAPSPGRVALSAAEPYLTSQRAWLDRLAVVVPAPAATRWLLVADLACLIALGLATRRRALGVPLTLAAGFIVLNLLGMALTDFYLGLTVFHLLVGLVAMLTLSRARWLGAVTLGLVLVLGLVT